jgi:putative DNA methylase
VTEVKTRKKLIEVALPLGRALTTEERSRLGDRAASVGGINDAAAREKSIRHGHPSTLHLWWARRPLAAARAVIFAQVVDDPSSWPDLFPTAKKQEKERLRLFKIIEDMVQWPKENDAAAIRRRDAALVAAREEIWMSWRRACSENADHPRAKELFDCKVLPAFHDPFAGGGALPLEAQRLGLESYASDLNPVAVLINKAMIDIPPKFAGKPPVNPDARRDKKLFAREWKGAQGLAEDVRYYGQWMRDEAEKRIGHLYPKIEVTAEMAKERPDLVPYVGRSLTVIAWIWARTVRSPNPAFSSVSVPLASSFMLSTKEGREAYVKPVIDGDRYRFTVQVGNAKEAELANSGTTAGKRHAFKCLMSGVPINYDYIRSEGKAGRIGARLMAIVAEGNRGRVYLAPTPTHEAVAQEARPHWKPDSALPINPRDFKTPNYGLTTFADLFTPRQLVALATFSDLVGEARERIRHDALAAGLSDDPKPLCDGGTGATAYADAAAVYLSMSISKMADAQSSLCRWKTTMDQSIATFGRQALPMVWDYSEANAFGEMAGDPLVSLKNMMRVVDALPATVAGRVLQVDAQSWKSDSRPIASTDPPYYDNIGYADLSDFFYVWLRRSLRQVFPDLFATLTVPKAEELVATPYRHGGKEKAEAFFLDGMTKAMQRLVEQAHPAFPVTIYYAFKQSETESTEGTSSTGWETFLDAVIRAGFALSGTWPMRTELSNRMIGSGNNALASSIVLVCRKRGASAPIAARRDFVTKLKEELPQALAHLQAGNIAPVDLAQAAIGPGMAVYTRYAKVLDAEGKPLSVREALALINQTLDEALSEQEGDFDSDTRWALAWFDQHGFSEGEAGVAILLSTAKGTALNGLEQAGIVRSGRGKVRLLKANELPSGWDPALDKRLTAWEAVHHLIRVLDEGGETAAALMAQKLGNHADIARELAYRLYTMCERKKWAAEAKAYNNLVVSWSGIESHAAADAPPPAPKPRQQTLPGT